MISKLFLSFTIDHDDNNQQYLSKTIINPLYHHLYKIEPMAVNNTNSSANDLVTHLINNCNTIL